MTKHDASHSKKVLVVDTTARDQTKLGLILAGESFLVTEDVRAQELQKLIIDLLEHHQISFADLDTVAVLTGPGSFTGSRIGATAANTLHWLNKIPIIDIPGDDFEKAIEDLKSDRQLEVIERVLPRY